MNVSAAPREAAEHDPYAHRPVTVIRRAGWRVIDLGELWRYRELLFFLAWRNVKVRYKQTALGVAWVVLQPLATTLVFLAFLGRLAEPGTSGLAYALFVFAGLLPWTFVANAVSAASQSIVGSHNLVTKIYFPRLLIPMGTVGAGMVDFVIAFVLLLAAVFLQGTVPGGRLLLLPGLVLGLMITALGAGALLAALTVVYRDFRYVVPFLVQLWMFATPSIYLQGDDVLGPWGRALLPLNPAHGLIANFRLALLGSPLDLPALAMSSSVGLALFVLGCFAFGRLERRFADII